MSRFDRFTPHTIQTKWELAFAILVLIAIFGWVGQMDYADERMRECADLSTADSISYWDANTDTCKVEKRKVR